MLHEVLTGSRQLNIVKRTGIEPVLAARGIGQALFEGVGVLDVDELVAGIDVVDTDPADLGDLLKVIHEDDIGLHSCQRRFGGIEVRQAEIVALL